MMTSHPYIARFFTPRAWAVLVVAHLVGFAIAAAVWRQRPTPPRPPATPPRQYLSLPPGPWGDGPRGAIVQTGREVDGFVVPIGQARREGAASRFLPDRPDWAAMARSSVPATLALRLKGSPPGPDGSDPADDDAWTAASAALRDGLTSATGQGVVVEGLQLDLLEASGDAQGWQARAHGFATQWRADNRILSLAVPARWVAQGPSLSQLTEGFDRLIAPWPEGADPGEPEWDSWLETLAAQRQPFLALLPGPAPLPSADGASSDLPEGLLPSAMARALTQLRQQAPAGLVGWVWHGLPASDGAALWTWPALRAVMMGRTPETALTASILQIDPYIFEIWLQNTGESAPTAGSEARFILYWRGRVPGALAMRTPYYMDHTQTIIRGPVPQPGQRVLVGEFSLLDTSPGLLLPQVGSASLAR